MTTSKTSGLVKCESCGSPVKGEAIAGFKTECPICVMSENEYRTKQPIGLMPERVWQSRRMLDLCDALERYQQEDLTPPLIWIHELRRLITE